MISIIWLEEGLKVSSFAFPALQFVVRAFKREKERCKENTSKAAKRRRAKDDQVLFDFKNIRNTGEKSL